MNIDRRKTAALIALIILGLMTLARADEITDCIRDRANEWFDSPIENTLPNNMRAALTAQQVCGGTPDQVVAGFLDAAQERLEQRKGGI